MRVKRLKMEAFRGIGDLTLDFDETEPTVLIGINGVGKSSILDCLAILLSHMIGRFLPQDDDVSNFNSGINLTGDYIKINGDIFGNVNLYMGNSRQFKWLENKKNKIRYFQEQDITNGSITTYNEIAILMNDNHLLGWFLQKDKNALQDFQAMDTYINHLIEYIDEEIKNKADWPLAVYYPVNRAVREINIDNLDNFGYYSFTNAPAYEQALSGVQISFNEFFQWFKTLEDIENEIRQDNPNYLRKELEAVRKAIYSLIPDFSSLRVRRSPLRMTVQKQGEELIINQLSDGEKCLLAMVGDLARRLAIANPGLSDPLQGSGVVLIDEIELHLHPKWQREIIPALTRTFPNCQFIVTTHSPQVVSHVKPEGIYILEKTDTGVIAKRPESSFGRDSNQILEDLMDVPARPQEIKDSLLQLFRLIDAGDLTSARELRQQLAAEIGADEPDFVKADVLIRRKEIIGR